MRVRTVCLVMGCGCCMMGLHDNWVSMIEPTLTYRMVGSVYTGWSVVLKPLFTSLYSLCTWLLRSIAPESFSRTTDPLMLAEE